MTKKINRHPSDKELNFQLSVRKIDNRARTTVNIANAFLKYSCIVLIFFFLYLSVKELAGRNTDANIFFSIMGDIKLDQWVAFIFGSSGVTYGLVQRNLRRKTIKRISTRCDELERKINPNKKSSGITSEGKTQLEDQQWAI